MITAHGEYLELLAQADLLLLIGRVLDQPSETEQQAWALGQTDRHELIRASGLSDPVCAAEMFDRVSDAVAHTDMAQWSEEHCRLFEAVVVCPINESAYIRRDKGAILSDICGFYSAFGFSLSAEIGEKADHMIGELQFFSLLLVMAADALKHGHEEKGQIAREAARSFAKDHLGEWIFTFCDRLGESTSLTLYQCAAMLLALIWKAICDRHEIPLHKPLSILEPESDIGTPYECGIAEGCGAGPGCGSSVDGPQ